jgi:hypothetical protein
MANESTPAKPKISLAPVKALSKPLIDANDVPKRTPVAPVATKSAAKPAIAKPVTAAIKSLSASPPIAKLPVIKPSVAKPVVTKSPITKSPAPKPFEASPAKMTSTKGKLAVAAVKSKSPALASPVTKIVTAKLETVAPVAAKTALPQLAMFDAMYTVQQRTAELAQTLISASQDDLSKLLAPIDPATMLSLQVAAMSRTQAMLKAYWSDIISVAQHKT